jgi:hypothetical protein
MFREEYERQMNDVRNQANQEFVKLAEVYNSGQISKKEWHFNKDKVILSAHEQRRQIIAKREFDVDREEERVLNRIVGTDKDSDMQRYRTLYSQYAEKGNDKDYLLKEYNTSIKLNDSLAGKAAAAVAAEHGIREIAADYSVRDESFANAINDYRAFKTKWRDPFRKFSEYQSGKFGFIREPKSKTETYGSGFVVDEYGRKLPQFRERVKYE